jgi:hypothetical protein
MTWLDRCPTCGGPAEFVDGCVRSTVAGSEPTRLVEAAVPDSFNDIRQRVEQALTTWYATNDAAEDAKNGNDPTDDDDDFSVDVWVCDLGTDWVVWESYGSMGPGPGQWKMTYTLDAAGTVTLDGTPTKVETLTQYVPAKEARDRIHGRVLESKGTDTAGGRIFDVQIIAFGDSRNGRRYPQQVMTEAVSKYEGAKAYDHHRTDEELTTSTINGLVGAYQNVTATTEGLQGDLHLLPSATHAAEALDASLVAQSQGLPPIVGISHDVMALYKPITVGGKRFMEATEIHSVNSADVVADPAAGGKATRMVAGGSGADPEEGNTMTLKELLASLREATPEKRTELLQEHKATVEEFGLDEAAIGRILAEDPPSPVTPPVTDPATPPAPAVPPVTDPAVAPAAGELVLAKESALGRMLIRDAVTSVGLDAKFVESIAARLPDRFSESVLTTHVAAYQDMRVELEKELMVRSPEGIIPHVAVTGEERTKKISALDAMFDDSPARMGEGYRSLKQAFLDITGLNTRGMGNAELSQAIMRESIGSQQFDSAATRSTESAQSGTWNLILGDSITRRMVAMYEQPNLQTWRSVASSIVPIVDFRLQRLDRLGGYGVLPGVNQGAPYQPLTTPGNEEATYQISKLGGTEDLTLETIANDDLRAVQRIPTLLGLAAAQTLYRFVWGMLINNVIYTPDTTALFAAGHNNTAATALSNGNLSAARAAMRQQTAYGDAKDILSILPKFLVVNSSLEQLAYELTESAVAVPTTAPDGGAAGPIPNLHQGMQAIVVDFFTATSTTNWFVVADPNLIPTIELGFYNGQVDPELFVQNDPTVGSVFTADKITYKIRHIYGGTVVDFRGLYRGNS